MENYFNNIECGEGTSPRCRFTLQQPVNAGKLGTVYGIDVKLSDSGKWYDVWLVSKENGSLYYKLVRNKVPSEVAKQIEDCVNDAIRTTTNKTRENRKENYMSVESLREKVRETVSEKFYKMLKENKNRK